MRTFSRALIGCVVLLLVSDLGLAQPPDPGQGAGRGFGRGGFDRGGRGGRGFFSRDPNEMFNNMTGGKDVWVRSEITDSFQQRMFDRAAQSLGITNGQITRDQYTKYMQERMNSFGGRGGGPSGTPPAGTPGTTPAGAPGAGGAPDERMTRWADGMFRRYDANGDGVLNYDEMPESLRGEREKWDTNRNGLIEKDEYTAYFQAYAQQRMSERGGGGGGWGGGWDGQMPMQPAPEEEDKKPVVYRAGKLPKDIPSWFQQIDSDTDGQIGLYEWKNSGRPLNEFQLMDRNKDGFLTISEVMRYTTQQAKANGDKSNGSGPSPGNGPGGMGTFSPGNGPGGGMRGPWMWGNRGGGPQSPGSYGSNYGPGNFGRGPRDFSNGMGRGSRGSRGGWNGMPGGGSPGDQSRRPRRNRDGGGP